MSITGTTRTVIYPVNFFYSLHTH